MITTPTPGAPVPPQRLRHEWIDLSPLYRASNAGEPVRIGTDWDAAMGKAAAWGHAQAMPEREELIKLLCKSACIADSYRVEPDPTPDRKTLGHHARDCRAAAERLRGGGSDG
jgi:hypothetical protein